MGPRSAAGPAGKPLTVRVASWSARHRWPVVAAWFIFTFGLFATSMALGGTKTLGQMNGGVPRTESALADQLFAAGGQSAPHEDLYLVVRNPDLATTDPAYRAAVGDMIGRMAAVTDVVRPACRRAAPRSVHGPRGGRSHVRRRDEHPDRRGDRRRFVGRHGEGRGVASGPCLARGRTPGLRGARAQQHAHQRGSQQAHRRRPRRIAQDHAADHVPDPARGLRRGRRGRRAARAGPHRAPGRLRDPGHLQPARGTGRDEREPAGRPHRPRGWRGLLAVHDHPLPNRAPGGKGQARRHRDGVGHGRARRLLQRAGRGGLARRPVPRSASRCSIRWPSP